MNSSRGAAGSNAQPARRATSERTSARILDAAHRLFNEQGTSAVSTNHIAAAADLSPGNLYYHFKHKREIIRALFARYAEAHEDLWEPGPDAGENLAKLRENMASGLRAIWEYRFFEREILTLLRADPELRAAYVEVYHRRLGEWGAFIELLVAQRMMRPPRPPRTLHDLVLALWLVAGSWLAFLDVTGDPRDPAQVAKGADLLTVIFDPYLSAEGRRRFATPEPGTSAKEHK
ncbi:MAG: TetR/AcrR family transcriptional regulator [Stackebrandtia sp.]